MAEYIVSSQWFTAHPPCVNPPVGSSSGPPGACVTPSTVTNIGAMRLLMGDLLQLPACRRVLDRAVGPNSSTAQGETGKKQAPKVPAPVWAPTDGPISYRTSSVTSGRSESRAAYAPASSGVSASPTPTRWGTPPATWT